MSFVDSLIEHLKFDIKPGEAWTLWHWRNAIQLEQDVVRLIRRYRKLAVGNGEEYRKLEAEVDSFLKEYDGCYLDPEEEKIMDRSVNGKRPAS